MASQSQEWKKVVGALSCLGLTCMLAFQGQEQLPAFVTTNRLWGKSDELAVASWNMAAINNNPFEYWLSLDNAHYDSVMNEVQAFITDPGDRDIRVDQVFTSDMMDELVRAMTSHKHFEKEAIDATIEVWEKDFRSRRIVSRFIKDGSLGKKRLTSMPDRVTNTIALKDETFAYRPTVINCFSEPLDTMDEWWQLWKAFMFEASIDTVKVGKVVPADMLAKIPRAKYPDLTVGEERISIPLQTLTCAIFDAILVHMLNTLDAELVASSAGADAGEVQSWQGLRSQICQNLNLRKNDRILEIIKDSYMDRDVVCLQEVAGAFIKRAEGDHTITNSFHVVAPSKRSRSDQNSVLLLSKKMFNYATLKEVTDELVYDDPSAIASGDVVLVRVLDKTGRTFIIGSFHGDTNGLATIPLVTAVSELVMPGENLLLGLDANTYEKGIPNKKQDVLEFAEKYGELGLDSCWGPKPNPKNYTTFNARTYLQPQLNKASSKAEIRAKGDVNPKDFILFKAGGFSVLKVGKDNTGNREYVEGLVFPTLEFPSDHGILSALFDLSSAEL